MSNYHPSHHHTHPHNVVLNLKDLDSTLAASHGGEAAVHFEETVSKNHHAEHETAALVKLSKTLKGTKYEAALERLIQNKVTRVDSSNEAVTAFVPSPEKVKDEVELLKLGRFLTSTTLENYLDVPPVHSSATKDLAKPYPKNVYKKVSIDSLLAGSKCGNTMSTNHLGRQNPTVDTTGIDNNGALDLQKTALLTSPSKEKSRMAAASVSAAANALARTQHRRKDGTIVEIEESLPPTSPNGRNISSLPATNMNHQRVMDSAQDLHSSSFSSSSSLPATSYYQQTPNGGQGMSVSLSDFDVWLNSNKNWDKSAADKRVAAKEVKIASNPKLYKQSAHMKEIYAQRLKAYKEHKEEKLLQSFITKKPNERVRYDERTNTVKNEPTFQPELNAKTRKIVAKRDNECGRTSDIAMAAHSAYSGPIVKREPLQSTLPKFVGLSKSHKQQQTRSRSPSPLDRENRNRSNFNNSNGGGTPVRKATTTDCGLTVNQLNTTGSYSESIGFDSRSSPSRSYMRYSKPDTPSSERRSRSLTPRLSYSAEDNKTPHQRESSPSAFGSSCRSSRFNSSESDKNLHFSQRGRSTTRSASSTSASDRGRGSVGNATPFLAPRCSSPTFSQRCCMVVKEGLKSTFRSASEPRERRDFKYMTAEAKRVLAPKQDTFTDRIMASVERFYTHIGTQKQIREKLYGKNCDNKLLTSVSSTLGHAISNMGFISGGAGGMAAVSFLGPGQYSKTEVHGSRGYKSRTFAGQRGYSFSQLPRATSIALPNPVKSGGGVIGIKTTDWKTDLAKSGAPIHAQLKEK